MKIKDLVSLQGCYSAHDVGEFEIPNEMGIVPSEKEIEEIIRINFFDNSQNRNKWTFHAAKAIRNLMLGKENHAES